MIGKPIMIEDVEYMVAWDSELNRARIVYPFPADGTAQLTDLADLNGNEMSFGTELDAIRYLIGMKVEVEGFDPKDTTWKTIA
jgi:hypothetical protein